MRQGKVRSYDGTPIAYQVFGEGPPLVLANGVGVSYGGFRPQIDHFERTRTLITWDYRGTHSSGAPPPGGDLSPAAHARDLMAVLRAEGIKRSAILGWSLGVQVLMEFLRLDREAISAAVTASGTSGRPFRTAFGLPGTDLPIRVFLQLAHQWHGIPDRIMRLGPELPFYFWFMKKVRWIAPSCDREVILEMTRHVASLDKELYFSSLLALGDHDAGDLLGGIDFPVLIIAGEHDRFTPPRVARGMQRKIRGSELYIAPGATHYCLIEAPETLNPRIARFLRKHSA